MRRSRRSRKVTLQCLLTATKWKSCWQVLEPICFVYMNRTSPRSYVRGKEVPNACLWSSLSVPLPGFPVLQPLEVVGFIGGVTAPQRKHNAGLVMVIDMLKQEYQIRLKADAVSISLSAPRQIPILLESVRQKLKKMEAEGVIRLIDKRHIGAQGSWFFQSLQVITDIASTCLA